MAFKDVTYQFGVALKQYPLEGNLAYEYNPLRNYRVNLETFFYKNRLYTLEELALELGKTIDEIKNKNATWSTLGVPSTETEPVLIEPGQITDFETDELEFDLNHPVTLTPYYSYDDSVDIIINDGKHSPKLINSRFSATERNKYKIVDRKGDNDSNIYGLGVLFDIDTSLYKNTLNIPTVSLVSTEYGGNLFIGNYHFYFKYVDADGNETDFVAESGLVSMFIGSTPTSCHTGERDMNSYKMVKFRLKNLDSAYLNIVVYYTRSTGLVLQNSVTKAYKILDSYIINNWQSLDLTITGFELADEITIDEINLQYLIYDNAETQDICLNMLFMANLDKPDLLYLDLSDIALRFCPEVVTEQYQYPDSKYKYSNFFNSYCNSNFIYNKLGYWPDEIYRFGIVFIFSNGVLSPVFSTRGVDDLKVGMSYHNPSFINDVTGKREYISYTLDDFLIKETSNSFENAKGVVRLSYDFRHNDILGIKFNLLHLNEVLEELQKLSIKGFFFVRQRRLPTTICLAYTIGIDRQSYTPVIPYNDKFITESFLSKGKLVTISGLVSSLIGGDDIGEAWRGRALTHDFDDRIRELDKHQVRPNECLICPEYDVHREYLNSLFTGSQFQTRLIRNSKLTLDSTFKQHFYTLYNNDSISPTLLTISLVGVEDDTKMAAINNTFFSARAGEAEEAFRFEYIGKELKATEADNLLRGSYGPYIGAVGSEYEECTYLDIKIPGYNESNMLDYFKIRYSDKSLFMAISDRIDLEKVKDYYSGETMLKPLYRGDCYLCQFTHRLNRNFQDPSVPYNDKIVDKYTWLDNYEVKDEVINKEKFLKINLGDVNAVKLGLWITLLVRSTMNLNVRTLDESWTTEIVRCGHPRGFYPYSPMSNAGTYKIPEALCYNQGFQNSLSSRYNIEMPDVPAIKNEFSNRICYSDVRINSAFANGFRVFKGTHYRDYTKEYGSITKIITVDTNLVCVFEHGVALLPINERALAGEAEGGEVYLTAHNVLPEKPTMLSDTFGSLWRDSVIKTPKFVYGVDTIGKKIWRCAGNSFECISDFKVLKFLIDNISLTERELTPIIGVRNVKTHYNAYKGDVMFTFYDNLHGFEEKVWNLCWNEHSQKWITFYSWVPSYSENIYNQFYSFDRNTSKWIAKLGVSNTGNNFSDGVTIDTNEIDVTNTLDLVVEGPNTIRYKILGNLSLSNRNIPKDATITFEVVRDNYGNYKNFEVVNGNLLRFQATDEIPELVDLCSEFYKRVNSGGNVISFTNNSDITTWKSAIKSKRPLPIYKNKLGRREWITDSDLRKVLRLDKVVILLNIRAKIELTVENQNSYLEAISTGLSNLRKIDGGYYESTIALIPNYNMQFLTTDFWKHGLAGIIDIADKIFPTYWYGKLHPFEFEFIVNDKVDMHKIFDNLLIVSNNAEPESLHYEIIGDCFEFAKDKENMYIRLEATKEFYLYNGSDIAYDHDYTECTENHRPYKVVDGVADYTYYDKSTLFPLFYSRLDTINEIEDCYHLKNGSPLGKDFSALAGAEIVRYPDLLEFRIWNHTKAVPLELGGRIRGNMLYKEDKWYIQINPINIVQCNEPDWAMGSLLSGQSDLVPIEIGLCPVPKDIKTGVNKELEVPDTLLTRAFTKWLPQLCRLGEVKVKDKYVKIRIRYKGDKLAVISAIKTLYSISYA